MIRDGKCVERDKNFIKKESRSSLNGSNTGNYEKEKRKREKPHV